MRTKLRTGLLPTLRLAVALALLSGASGARAQAGSAPSAPAPAPGVSQGGAPAPAAAQPTAAPPAELQAPANTYPAAPPGTGYAAPPPPLYQPAPYSPQSGGYRPRRPSKGLMITGISILGGSYLLAISVGAALLDESNDDDDYSDCRNCRDVAPWLFLPLAGPFIAMSQTDDGDWGLWMLGMVEAVGTGLMIGGIVRFVNTKRAAEMQSFSRWQLPGRRELALDVASSPRFAGPRLRLTF